MTNTELRTAPLSVACPLCEAEPSEPCWSAAGGVELQGFHDARFTAAEQADADLCPDCGAEPERIERTTDVATGVTVDTCQACGWEDAR